jgi:hypothetical protein
VKYWCERWLPGCVQTTNLATRASIYVESTDGGGMGMKFGCLHFVVTIIVTVLILMFYSLLVVTIVPIIYIIIKRKVVPVLN